MSIIWTKFACPRCQRHGCFDMFRTPEGFRCERCATSARTSATKERSSALVSLTENPRVSAGFSGTACLTRTCGAKSAESISSSMAPTCSNCSKPISSQNRSGLCRPCVCRRMTADPAIDAKRREKHVAACRTPENRHRSSERVKAYLAGNEAARQERRERGYRDYHKTLGSPQARAAGLSPDVIERRAKTFVENRLGWCPAEYREHYYFLLRKKQIPAAEAKRMILSEIEAAKPKLSAFERQLERIRQGASIIEVRPIRKAEPTFTLGGVSSI